MYMRSACAFCQYLLRFGVIRKWHQRISAPMTETGINGRNKWLHPQILCDVVTYACLPLTPPSGTTLIILNRISFKLCGWTVFFSFRNIKLCLRPPSLCDIEMARVVFHVENDYQFGQHSQRYRYCYSGDGGAFRPQHQGPLLLTWVNFNPSKHK